MKRVVLICSMLMATVHFAGAQQAVPAADVAAPISKSDFMQKVKDFDKFIGQGNVAEADKKFNEISPMIHAELKVMRYKIRDTQDEAEKKTYETYTTKQRVLYGEIATLKKDMANNRKVLIDKLNEFAESIQ